MSVGTICNREVVITEKESSVSEAAKLMRDYHVGNVIVAENRNGLNYPIGMVTDRDIVIKLIAKDIDIDAVDVGIIMAEDLVVARENDDLIDTVKKMCSKGIRRLPVVDAGGRPDRYFGHGRSYRSVCRAIKGSGRLDQKRIAL